MAIRFVTSLLFVTAIFASTGALAQTDDDAEDTARAATPVNTTVLMVDEWWMQNAVDNVDRAAELGNTRVNVVPTIHVDLTDDYRVKSYGLVRSDGRGYVEFDDALRAQLKKYLHDAFAQMVQHNMDIYILPHIDAGTEVHTWRNWIDFDPLVPYQGYTYENLLLDSIVEALEETVTDDTRVELALSGEMGRSLFTYPESHMKTINRLRENSKIKNLKVGISLNHSLLAGFLPEAPPEEKTITEQQRKALQEIIDTCDFVGISMYKNVTLPVTKDDFVTAIDQYMGELDALGLKVPTSTPLHFSEVGIGGGYQEEGPTDDPAKAVQSPWAGTANPRDNPWRNEAMRDLRRQFHQAALDFLMTQPAPWQVTAAFFWSMGSWDPQGISNEEFADPEIMAAVREHNQAISER